MPPPESFPLAVAALRCTEEAHYNEELSHFSPVISCNLGSHEHVRAVGFSLLCLYITYWGRGTRSLPFWTSRFNEHPLSVNVFRASLLEVAKPWGRVVVGMEEVISWMKLWMPAMLRRTGLLKSW